MRYNAALVSKSAQERKSSVVELVVAHRRLDRGQGGRWLVRVKRGCPIDSASGRG